MMLVSFLPLCEDATTAKYWMTFLVFSVLPAPDSPLEKKVEQPGMNVTRSPKRSKSGAALLVGASCERARDRPSQNLSNGRSDSADHHSTSPREH